MRFLAATSLSLILAACGQMDQLPASMPRLGSGSGNRGGTTHRVFVTMAQRVKNYHDKIEEAKAELVRCRDDVTARTNLLHAVIATAMLAKVAPTAAVAELLNGVRDQVGKEYCDRIYSEATHQADIDHEANERAVRADDEARAENGSGGE